MQGNLNYFSANCKSGFKETDMVATLTIKLKHNWQTTFYCSIKTISIWIFCIKDILNILRAAEVGNRRPANCCAWSWAGRPERDIIIHHVIIQSEGNFIRHCHNTFNYFLNLITLLVHCEHISSLKMCKQFLASFLQRILAVI